MYSEITPPPRSYKMRGLRRRPCKRGIPTTLTRCPLLHTALSYTLPSLTHRPLLHAALSYTPPSLTRCPLLHTALSYTPPSLTHRPLLHAALSYTPPSLTHHPLLHNATSYTHPLAFNTAHFLHTTRPLPLKYLLHQITFTPNDLYP